METEFPRWFKIVLLLGAVILFFYGIFKTVFLTVYAEIIANSTGLSVQPLFMAYIFSQGMLQFFLGGYMLIIIRVNDWDKCKISIGFLFVYLIWECIANLTAPTGVGWDGFILSSIFIVPYSYFIYTQLKK